MNFKERLEIDRLAQEVSEVIKSKDILRIAKVRMKITEKIAITKDKDISDKLYEILENIRKEIKDYDKD